MEDKVYDAIIKHEQSANDCIKSLCDQIDILKTKRLSIINDYIHKDNEAYQDAQSIKDKLQHD